MASTGLGPELSNGYFIIGVTTTDFSALNSAESDWYYSSPGAVGPPYYPSTYSFQQAIKPIEYLYSDGATSYVTHAMYLFTNGCENDNGRNCTQACLDPAFVFRHPTNLHNCVTYPTIAKFYNDGNITANTPDSNLLDSLAIKKSAEGSELLNDMTSMMQKCLRSYCDDSSGCGGYFANSVYNSTGAFFFGNETDSGSGTGTNDPIQQLNEGLTSIASDICQFQLAGLNADIGGIGVFISYWIQCGLAVVGSLAILWWRRGIRYWTLFTHSIGSRHVARREYSQRAAIKTGDKHLPATCSALVEFQKAQCFFMLAINIAAQVNRGRGGFQPINLQQLSNNYNLIQTISINGFLPITFTMFTLHTVDMISWYLILLSVLTVAFSTATLVDIGNFSPSQVDLDYLLKQAATGGPAACNDTNILVYCLHPPSSSPFNRLLGGDDGIRSYSILGFCLLVLLLLVLKEAKLFTKLSSLRSKPSRSKMSNFLISNFLSIKGIQFGLAILLCVFEPLLGIPPLFPPMELICLLYVFVASDLNYSARKTKAGKMYSKWGLLFTEVLSCTTSCTDFITQVFFLGNNSIYDGILMALVICLWLSFILTFISTSLHIHKTLKRNGNGKKKPRERPAFLRRLSAIFSPTWRSVRSIFVNARSSALASGMRSTKRNIKSAMEITNLTAKLPASIISLVYFSFFVIYIYWFVLYFFDLYSFGIYVDFDTWSFGQIVAITVWTQPLCEYLHLELRGMRHGFQHRLMWPYRVVTVTQEDDDEYDAERAQKRPAIVIDETPRFADETLHNTTATSTFRTSAVRDSSQERLLRQRADSAALSTTTSTPLTRAASTRSSPGETSANATAEVDISAEAYHETYDRYEGVELESLSKDPRKSSSSSSRSSSPPPHPTNWQIPDSVLKTSDEITF